MRPPRQSQIDYERIQKYDEWISGDIAEIQLREDHDTGFKYPAKKDDGAPHPKAGEPIICDQVRLKFALEGHNYPHYSRWMRYSYGEKSNLYLKYLKYLVEGAQPDMNFDLESLTAMKVKTMWSQSEDGKFDNLEQIRPLNGKCKPEVAREEIKDEPPEEVVQADDIPFS
jgi:hypothetical protein